VHAPVVATAILASGCEHHVTVTGNALCAEIPTLEAPYMIAARIVDESSTLRAYTGGSARGLVDDIAP
jgi:hypothetical protein